MENKITMAYAFDFVHDSQQVFRAILNALSNPGQVYDIRKQTEKFKEDFGALSAVGATLLDNEVSMYVEKNPKLEQQMHHLTLCRPVKYCYADYIFLSSEMNYGSIREMMKHCKKGTYADPQTSATFVILCENFDREMQVTLSGPGVKNEMTVSIRKYIRNILMARAQMDIEYPLGIDLIFVSKDGQIQAYPRLCQVRDVQLEMDEQSNQADVQMRMDVALGQVSEMKEAKEAQVWLM